MGWEWLPWRRRAAARRRAQRAAEREQALEHERARQRLMNQARRTSALNEPTLILNGQLLTQGQEYRSRRGHRW